MVTSRRNRRQPCGIVLSRVNQQLYAIPPSSGAPAAREKACSARARADWRELISSERLRGLSSVCITHWELRSALGTPIQSACGRCFGSLRNNQWNRCNSIALNRDLCRCGQLSRGSFEHLPAREHSCVHVVPPSVCCPLDQYWLFSPIFAAGALWGAASLVAWR
jgi:hypothetical protein